MLTPASRWYSLRITFMVSFTKWSIWISPTHGLNVNLSSAGALKRCKKGGALFFCCRDVVNTQACKLFFWIAQVPNVVLLHQHEGSEVLLYVVSNQLILSLQNKNIRSQSVRELHIPDQHRTIEPKLDVKLVLGDTWTLSDRCRDKSLEYLQTRPRCS